MLKFPSIAHVAVTVSDLETSVKWYTRLFGTEPVLDEDELVGGFHHAVYAIGGGQLFGLHTHPSPIESRFDEHAPGLDHVAFDCGNRAGLEGWSKRLDELGVRHADIVDAHYGSGMSVRDPDGVALEFFAPPG